MFLIVSQYSDLGFCLGQDEKSEMKKSRQVQPKSLRFMQVVIPLAANYATPNMNTHIHADDL